MKKNYLSKGEQQVWESLNEREIIDLDLFSDIFPEIPSSKRNKVLHSLKKKGFLQRAARGLYYNPQRLKDSHILALRINEGYIGLTSALRLYNLLDYEDFTIFVITRSFRRKVVLNGTQHTLQFIPFHDLYAGFARIDGIIASTIEKTLFDCLLKPNLVGYSVISKAFYDARQIDWNNFLQYFQITSNHSIAQRAGYLLEMLRSETKKRIPSFVFKELHKYVKNPVKLLAKAKSSKFNGKWKIQDNLGKQNILSWWY